MTNIYFSPYYTKYDSKTLKNNELNDIANVTFLDPVPYIPYMIKTRGKEDVFIKCPAVTEHMRNCYVILAPFDLEIEFDNTRLRVVTPSLSTNSGAYNFINGYKVNRTLEQPKGSLPLLSLPPMYTFYSLDNVQIELLPPLMFSTAAKFNVLPGKFNINKWIRPVDWTFEVFNPSQNLIIKRKDPLFVIRFITENNSKVELERVFCTDDLYNISKCTAISRNLVPNLSLKERYNMATSYIRSFFKKHHHEELKQKEKKCPMDIER